MNQNKKQIILEVENLKKFFKNAYGIVNAVDGVSFNVHQGEIVGLVGESGSGKTTVGRSLIHLHDDFSGFVSLNNQVISGKHLSKKTNLFLRKNMQMIFQDPHASLNNQKNVFSILKEPLVVNGLLKKSIKNVKKDLNLIQYNFRYDFQTQFYKTKIEILEKNLALAHQGLDGWLEKLNNLDFKQYKNIGNAFDAYFSFYETNYSLEAEAITYQYQKYDELYEFYYQKQKQYRNNELNSAQIQLAIIDQKIEKLKSNYYTKFWKKPKSDDQIKLKEFSQKIKEKLLTNANLLNSFASEFLYEAKLAITKSQTKTSNHEWAHWQLMGHINKQAYKLIVHKLVLIKIYLNQAPVKLLYLNNQEIKQLITAIKTYIKEFALNFKYNKPFNKGFEKNYINQVKQEFKFDLNPYLVLSQKNYEVDINKKNLLKTKTTVVTNTNVKITTHQYHENLNALLDERKIALKDFNLGLNTFLVDYKKNKQLRYTKLTKLSLRWKIEIINLQTKILKKLELKHKEFLVWATAFLKAENKTLVEQQLILNELKDKINEKKQFISNFKTEIKLIQKALNEMQFLYGSPTKFFYRFIQKFYKDHKKFKTQKRLVKGIKIIDKFHHLFKQKVLKHYFVRKIILRERIYQVLKEVGLLSQFAYRYPHEFSGGQRQRIVIARALITKPKLIIADEPIASLDISIQAQIVNLFKELVAKHKIGIVFVAHDLSMVEYIADKVMIMHLGKIVEHGKTQKIYDNPIHPYTNNLFDAIPKMSNANQPFKASDFDISYLKEQKFPNVIKDYQVEPNHYVLGTQSQFKKWIQKSNFRNS